MKIKKCVNCGYCCSTSACAFGEWDESTKKCKFLKFKGNKSYCNNYKEIETVWFSRFNPAFGAGCCSNLNTYRRAIIINEFNGIDQYIENANH